jgi:hypothetical protein
MPGGQPFDREWAAMSQRNPLHDRVIFKPSLKALLGDANDMRIHRLTRNTDSGFPQPQFLGRRPWWWEAEVRHWLEGLPRRPRFADLPPRARRAHLAAAGNDDQHEPGEPRRLKRRRGEVKSSVAEASRG